VQRNSRASDSAAELAVSLVELHGVLDAFDEALRLLRVRLLENPPPEHLMPLEWVPISRN
jgi:hypothetical protein